MKNETLYKRTVDILLDAYNGDKLKHGNCSACAVGNIVAANGGFKDVCDGDVFPAWSDVFITALGEQEMILSKYKGVAKEEIDQTGYSLLELAAIEFAFEKSIDDSPKGRQHYSKVFGDVPYSQQKEGQFIGLCAVLDVLKKIHSVENEAHEENAVRLETIYKLKVA